MSHRFAVATLFVLACSLVAPGLEAGTLLVANKSDATLTLIDLPSGEIRATLPTGAGPHEVAVSLDGKRAVVANYGQGDGTSLTLVDVAQGEVVKTIDLGKNSGAHGIDWVDARRVAVTTERSRRLIVVDVDSGETIGEVSTGQAGSHMVALSPDRKIAYVANIGSGTITAIDLVQGKKLGDLATGLESEGIAVTPDGREIWVSNRAADTVSVVSAESFQEIVELEAPGFPIRVEITPDGSRALVSCPKTGSISIFDTAEKKLLTSVAIAEAPLASPDDESRMFKDVFGKSSVPIGIEILPDGSEAWIACSQADAVVAVDLRAGKVTRLVETGRQPDGMAYSNLDVARD